MGWAAVRQNGPKCFQAQPGAFFASQLPAQALDFSDHLVPFLISTSSQF